jgi:hypothetical protein
VPAGSLSSRGPHMIALAALLVCFVLQLLGAKLPSVPLLIVGALVVFGWLVLYLFWHPRFSEERKSPRGRR